MEFKTEEELIEMGKCQLIRLVLDLSIFVLSRCFDKV